VNVRPSIACLPLFFLLFCFFGASCGKPADVETETTLTADERYIVLLYMKITETSSNLQDNPEEEHKKWEAVRESYDTDRVRAALDELSRNPERWIPVYERISELMKRRLDRERELERNS